MDFKELNHLFEVYENVNEQIDDIFAEVYADTYEKIIEDTITEEDIAVYLNVYEIFSKTDIMEKDLEKEQIVHIELVTLRLYLEINFAWRARSCANTILMLLDDEFIKKNKRDIAEIYFYLAEFYYLVRDRFNALDYYLKAFSYDKVKEIYVRVLVCEKELNPNQELVIEYPKLYTKKIKKQVEDTALIVDPIENTQKFVDLYDSIMEKTHSVLFIGDNEVTYIDAWNKMKELYSYQGIDWHTPLELNPKLREYMEEK